jgi:hypothetical protein
VKAVRLFRRYASTSSSPKSAMLAVAASDETRYVQLTDRAAKLWEVFLDCVVSDGEGCDRGTATITLYRGEEQKRRAEWIWAQGHTLGPGSAASRDVYAEMMTLMMSRGLVVLETTMSKYDGAVVARRREWDLHADRWESVTGHAVLGRLGRA